MPTYCVRTGHLLLLLLTLSARLEAQPSVTSTSGSWTHKGTVTVSGSGFGTKPAAAPVIWDDASGGDILDKWDGAWPNTNPTYNTSYRAPQRGIALPHNNVTKYIAGGHGQNAGPDGGYNVIFFKTRTISYPAYTYVSWYQRAADDWVFGGDNNYKTFAFSNGTGPYGMPNNWYLAYQPPYPTVVLVPLRTSLVTTPGLPRTRPFRHLMPMVTITGGAPR